MIVQQTVYTITYSLEVPSALTRKLGGGEGDKLPPSVLEKYAEFYRPIAQKYEERKAVWFGFWIREKRYILEIASLAVLLNARDYSDLFRKVIDLVYECVVEDNCEKFPIVKEAQEKLRKFTEVRDAAIQLGRTYLRLRASDVAIQVISNTLKQAASRGIVKSEKDLAELAQILASALKEVGMVESFSIE